MSELPMPVPDPDEYIEELPVVLLGDPDVGKTSLIVSLLSETLPATLPRLARTVRFPREETVPAALTIVDTDGSDPAACAAACAHAKVIVLVYDLSSEESLDRTAGHWFPWLRTLGLSRVPVILVGNKLDAVWPGEVATQEHAEFKEKRLMPIMEAHKSIQACVECSAAACRMVPEVFHFARKAALDALMPAKNLRARDGVGMAPRLRAALTHIFRVLDRDSGSGALDASDLRHFQERVFGSALSDADVNMLRTRLGTTAGTLREEDGSVTLSGFLTLHAHILRNDLLTSIWKPLRHFGYDESLNFRPERIVKSLRPERGSSDFSELSEEAKEHLIAVFRGADRDGDGHLSPAEFDSVLAAFPARGTALAGAPAAADGADGSDAERASEALAAAAADAANCPLWGTDAVSRCRTGPGGGLTVDGWLGMWHDLTLKDPRRAVASLSYVGMDVGAVEPLRWITEPRVSTHRNERSVFRGLVFGASGSGKTAFLRGLASKDFVDGYSPSSAFSVVHVFPAGDATGDRTLVLDEVCEADTEALLKRRGHGERLDIAVLLYDVSDPSSFAYAARVHQRLDREVPCLFVGTKGDLEEAEQVFGDEDADPETYCRDAGISAPEIVSLRDGASQALYLGIWRLANLPSAGNPYLRRKLDKLLAEQSIVDGMTTAGLVGIAAATAAVIGGLWWRFKRS